MTVVNLAAEKSYDPAIISGLRALADMLERGEGIDVPVTTCVILMGHSAVVEGQPYLRFAKWALGPRVDPFTVTGLMTVALAR